MSFPTFHAVEPPDPVDEQTEPSALPMNTICLVEAIQGQARFLSPAAKFLFFASCVLLVFLLPLLVAVGLFGSPLRLDRATVVAGGGLVLFSTMTLLYLLCRRSDKRRASDAFGKQVDRRPRI